MQAAKCLHILIDYISFRVSIWLDSSLIYTLPLYAIYASSSCWDRFPNISHSGNGRLRFSSNCARQVRLSSHSVIPPLSLRLTPPLISFLIQYLIMYRLLAHFISHFENTSQLMINKYLVLKLYGENTASSSFASRKLIYLFRMAADI